VRYSDGYGGGCCRKRSQTRQDRQCGSLLRLDPNILVKGYELRPKHR
jgi:hypothetical protein